MQFWFRKSDKDASAAYVGAEHKGVTGFAELRTEKRELLHAASAVAAALFARRLAERKRAVKRAQKEARRRMEPTRIPRKDPRRSTGMSLNVPTGEYRHKRR